MAISLIRFLLRHFVALTGLLALLGYVCVYTCGLANAPIRADGYSYYVYLPSWFLFGDPTLEHVARECCGGNFPAFTAIIRWPETGHLVNAHPIGVAIMTAPFFAVAAALSWWSNLPLDGFSLYFQHGAGLAGLCYFLAGLAVLRRTLERHFTGGVALATLVATTFGTNLYHYGVYESGYSHVFSFFLLTSLLSVTERWWIKPTRAWSVLLGLISALVVLTRHPNIVFLLIVPFYGVTRWSDLSRNVRRLRDRRRDVAIASAVGSVAVAPQLFIYQRATGHWFVSSYGELGFTFGSPHLTAVLFGVSKGLFFWSPVLLLAIAGMFVAHGASRQFRIAAVVVLAIHTYIVASWWDWQFGASFGHRAFTDALGLFAMFIASLFAWCERRPRTRVVIGAMTVACVSLSVAQMLQYWWRVLPISDTTWSQYRALFLRFP